MTTHVEDNVLRPDTSCEIPCNLGRRMTPLEGLRSDGFVGVTWAGRRRRECVGTLMDESGGREKVLLALAISRMRAWYTQIGVHA